MTFDHVFRFIVLPLMGFGGLKVLSREIRLLWEDVRDDAVRFEVTEGRWDE